MPGVLAHHTDVYVGWCKSGRGINLLLGYWRQTSPGGSYRTAPGRVIHRLPAIKITSTIPTTDSAKPTGIL